MYISPSCDYPYDDFNKKNFYFFSGMGNQLKRKHLAIFFTFLLIAGLIFIRRGLLRKSKLIPFEASIASFEAQGINEVEEYCIAQKPQYSPKYNYRCKPCKSNKFHVVTTFFPVTHKKYENSLGQFDTDGDDVKVFLQKRDQELLDVLQRNLNHNLVGAVHIIYEIPFTVKFLMKQKLENSCKLVFHRVRSDPTYRDAIGYAGTYLKNRLVIFTNQDVYLGEGWERVDVRYLRESKLMYALTRHGQHERYCDMPDPCRLGLPYLGSHDAFAFVLTKRPTYKELKTIEFKNDVFGAENFLIDFFLNTLDYYVLNPCPVLHIYHAHCIDLHNKKRPRINKNMTVGMIGYTNSLRLE